MENKNLISNEVTKEMNSNEKTNTLKTKRKVVSDPVYSVLQRARAQFNRQVVQDTDTKRICIERNISAFYSDPLRFWTEFKDEVNDLLDSVRFNTYCKDNGLNKTYVAEHVVFEGRSTKNNVWKNGLGVLGETVRMFNAPLYIDREGLYRKQLTAGSGNLQAGNAEKMEAAVSVPIEKTVA